MSYTLQHIYKAYVDTNEYIDKKVFRDICEEFNISIMEDILEGNTFNMGNNLSTLSVVRKERDPKRYITQRQVRELSGTYTIQTDTIVSTTGVKVSVEFLINLYIDLMLQGESKVIKKN